MSNLRPLEAVFNALKLIKQHGGNMRSGDIFTSLRESFPQTPYECEQTKSGNQRWENWLSFYSIDATKAGFLIKDKGMWHITDEGEKVLSLSLEDFAKELKMGYDNWKNNQSVHIKHGEQSSQIIGEIHEELIDIIPDIDSIQAKAENGIRDYIASK